MNLSPINHMDTKSNITNLDFANPNDSSYIIEFLKSRIVVKVCFAS